MTLLPIATPDQKKSFAAFLNVGAGAGALVVSCLILHAVLPPQEIPGVSEKLSYFAANKDRFDSLFIGSSRIYHGISPKTFDATAAAGGWNTHSFNFGLDDLKPPESFYLFERILDEHPAALREVFLELIPMQIDPRPSEEVTVRDVYWHDWRWTWALLREVRGGRAKGLYAHHSSRLYTMHTELFLENYANAGRGLDWLSGFFDSPPSGFGALGPLHDGFMPRTSRGWKSSARFTEAVAAFSESDRRRSLDDAGLRSALEELNAHCARLGIHLYLVVTPTLIPMPIPPAGIKVLAFNDPAKFPSLFRADQRTDWEHLDAEGADEFSRLLAQRSVTALTLGEAGSLGKGR